MLVDENIPLKNNLKLKVKLPQPKSQVENITVKKKLKLKVKLPRARSQLRRLGLLCENKDDGETASEIQIFTSSCFQSNVIGKFANTIGGTCGRDSSLKDLKNSNTNPKCESATSKRLGNPLAAYPKDSYMKSRCSHDNAFSEASSEKAKIDAYVKALKESCIEVLCDRDKLHGSHLWRFSGLGPTLDYSFLDYSYSSARDFAADVKLTFSNAMKYNPSTNWVHELAGEFSRMFTLEWKSLEAKSSEEEKSDLVYKDQGLMEISKRKLPPKLHGHLRRLDLL
ncbi:hypothetical protein Syun_028433 [Stephania yunnanensis]|uniref:Bromo domain-containing protein n=1 Tax=Stephania yunnanensis TaxID=152371 RepID=A0AAP0HQU6_9MAGN